MIPQGLENRVVVVTGGASGIGRETAEVLAALGARLALIDIDGASADAAAAEIRKDAPCLGLMADVADRSAMVAAAGRIEAELGPIYGLVACAGVSASAPAATLDDARWNRVIASNLTGSFLTCQAMAQGMIERGEGAIVLVGSTASLGGFAGRVNYAAAKHGVAGVAKTLAIEWGRFGIRVNAVVPGSIETARSKGAIPARFAAHVILDRTPLGRHGQPEEVAKAIAFLLSNNASFVTGAVLPVDGGLSAGYLTHRRGADMGTE